MQNMITILLADDDVMFKECIIFLIEAELNVNFILADSEKLAIKLIDENPNIDFIISDYKMTNGSGLEIFNYLNKQNKKKYFILLTACSENVLPEFKGEFFLGYIKKTSFMVDLIPLIKSQLGNYGGKIEYSRSFLKLKSSILLKMGDLPGDLYLKITDSKFIKIRKNGENFESHDFSWTSTKSVDYLYVKRDDFDIYFNSLLKFSNVILSGNTNSIESSFEFSSTVAEFIRVFSLSFDRFNNSSIKLVKDTINMAIKNTLKNNELKNMMENFKLNNNNYLNDHSSAIIFTSIEIALMLNWNTDSNFLKLATASILHDLALHVETFEEIELLERKRMNSQNFLSDKKLKNYLDHPFLMAEKIKTWIEVPREVGQIILQHHERPDGSGFPRKLGYQRIFPLAAVFIIAEDLIDFYFLHGPKTDFSVFIKEREIYYGEGIYNKIFKILANSIGNGPRK